jgi:hypothetical protein
LQAVRIVIEWLSTEVIPVDADAAWATTTMVNPTTGMTALLRITSSSG